MEPSLDLLPLPSLWMTRTAGSPFSPITKLEVRGEDCLVSMALRRPRVVGEAWQGGSRSQAIGPPHSPLDAGSVGRREKSEPCPGGPRGNRVSLCPSGPGGSPHPPSGGRSHSGSHEAGCLVPRRVSLGARQGLGLLGLRKASEGEGGGGGGDIWRQKSSQAWWLPFLAIPSRRHEGTGLSPGVCIQAVCLGPPARPGAHPKEPQ